MADLNAPATLEQAQDFAGNYGTQQAIIYEGATVLATHTLAGFVASNSVNDGVATANAIADVTIAATGTADTVKIVGGTREWDLAVGSEAILSTTNYIAGETSSISSMVITFPA